MLGKNPKQNKNWVGAIIHTNENTLILVRKQGQDNFSIPGGKVDFVEEESNSALEIEQMYLAGLQKEIREETNVQITRPRLFAIKDVVKEQPGILKRGRKQTRRYYLTVTAEGEEIKVNDHKEIADIKTFNFEHVRADSFKNVVSEQTLIICRRAIQLIEDEKREREGWDKIITR